MKIEEFINILRKLQTVGVDVSKMTQKDTTETLAKKSGISKEKLGEIGLEPTLKIGIQKYHIAQAYRGQGDCKPPTEEQVEELERMGISLEKQEKDTVQEFINILKKLQTVGVDVSKMTQRDTIEILSKKSGISKEKLEEMGLDPKLKIGIQKTNIAQAYRGQGTCKPPTKKQVEELERMGISLEKQEKDTVQEFINILKKLQTVGVDVSKMTQRDTIEILSKKSGISKEKLEEMGLDPKLKIGIQKTNIAQAYRGQGTCKPPTKKQVEELERMGISLEKQEKDTVQEFINILKKLQTIGVDVSKVSISDTIETLAGKSEISREKLKEIGVDPAQKIGSQKYNIAQAYRGKGTCRPPTKEQVEELAKLGISLEIQERDTVQDFINTIVILQTIGVDVSKVSISDTIETLAGKSEISREKLKEIGVDPAQKIGSQKGNIAQAYRGQGTSKPPTKEQVEELAKLGISLEKRERDIVQEFIDKLKTLQTIGVDVSKLVARDTIETLAEKSGINREKLEEMGLESTLKIGNQKTNIAKAYRGQGTSKPPTKKQVEELAKLGIRLERKRITGKKIAKASIISLTDQENADRAYTGLQELVKQEEQKRGVNLDEQP